MLYRTLVIAPTTNLVLVDDEVEAVGNALSANVLRGEVTAKKVLDKISEGWDIIWFMTHGVSDGIVLSDGPLSASALTTFIRTSGARLVVLNTCESIDVALDIHNELLTNLVCTLRVVPDRDAYFTGKQLAFHLARGKTFSQSYLAAKPGQNKDYLFLVGKDQEEQSAVLASVPIPKTAGSPDYANEIRRLDAIVSGDMLWGQEGLVNTVRSILTEMNAVKRAILVMQVGGITILLTLFAILVVVVGIYLTGGL